MWLVAIILEKYNSKWWNLSVAFRSSVSKSFFIAKEGSLKQSEPQEIWGTIRLLYEAIILVVLLDLKAWGVQQDSGFISEQFYFVRKQRHSYVNYLVYMDLMDAFIRRSI